MIKIQPKKPAKSFLRPKHVRERYSRRIKGVVVRSRNEREARKQSKYQHVLIGAEAIYYEQQELGISPLPPPRTIHN